MPSREETHYFGAGPAPLPTEVLEDASKALLNYKDLGYGIPEMSHRSPEANQILADTKAALSELLDIPDSYDILFLHGGGTGEFSGVVYHMVNLWVQRQYEWLKKTIPNWTEREKKVQFELVRDVVKACLKLDYLVTGSWSLKASQEAARLVGAGYVNVATDAREHNNGKLGVIPEEQSWTLSRPESHPYGPHASQPAFTYYCDNETVDGVEFPSFPESLEAKSPENDPLVVADMSSNFISRKVDISKYAAIFGGAQKNVGVTGITILIVRKSLLPPEASMASPDLMRYLGLPIGPIALDWATVAKNNSLYNTLPMFDVWVAGQVMSRLSKKYKASKVGGQEAVANKKAKMIYETLDNYPTVYQVIPSRMSRSRMNITLRVMGGSAEGEEMFLKGAKDKNLLGLKGHRSVGGVRISNCQYTPVHLLLVLMMKLTMSKITLSPSSLLVNSWIISKSSLKPQPAELQACDRQVIPNNIPLLC